MSEVFYCRRSGEAVARMSLGDGPAQASAAFCAALATAVTQFAADDGAKAAVLVSGDPEFLRDFSAAEWLALRAGASSPAALGDALHSLGAALRALETCGKPVVAEVACPRLSGAALELVLATHGAVALCPVTGDLPAVARGVLPVLGGAQRLARRVGIAAALPVLLDGAPADLVGAGICRTDLSAADLALDLAARAGGAVQPWDHKGFRIPGGAGPLAPHAMDSFMAGTSRRKAQAPRYPAPLAMLSAVYEGTQTGFDTAMRLSADLAAEVLAGDVAGHLLALAGPAPQDGPGVAAIRSAMVQAAQDALGAGATPALLRNTLRQAGLDLGFTPEGATAPGTGPQDAAPRLAAQILSAGAKAAAEALAAGAFQDAASASRASLLAGYPAWTGGALAWDSHRKLAW